jgi:hypothetical protein
MQPNIYDFIRNINRTVVEIVCHWNHTGRIKAPSKAARAHLAVNVFKETLIYKFGGENILILH